MKGVAFGYVFYLSQAVCNLLCRVGEATNRREHSLVVLEELSIANVIVEEQHLGLQQLKVIVVSVVSPAHKLTPSATRRIPRSKRTGSIKSKSLRPGAFNTSQPRRDGP
jgi:hypothetical protein